METRTEHVLKFYKPSMAELKFEQDLEILRQIQALVNRRVK